ncbi:3-hydroxyacyl-CoA dehydrogenase [Defluviimonas sp. 20V17]|uniref:Enoyl-CoA hydratase n=1 Tax=Allgaiera indica TaxID=765699 RepID=A0AAN4USE6_9RHOB|nr:3-hydroxyacyl-CoA dehydrogenase NAD-binding domain-containing protein [Allgaiera indica]KDB02282.1 3-hydroxyacyl-CoA dehydrogenase [Defluviimonas sp. 20V17]GHE02824.1 enoyl-CoA hydratase [Allgaiera indica]SDX17183.1 short chain enoyl-CoA hydratase /3-hydroxyacyl-CoA dehydrogenase [Allgaiera indica]
MTDTTRINDKISLERQDGIALVRIDNPPVNASGQAVRQGLLEAVDAANADTDVKVIAIYAAGRTFVAGADIREFGKPPKSPALPDVCNQIEASGKPVISVLHGTALGGGLELALATHARVGIKGLRVGLPEILLGLLPGAGGTQRGPRLIGMANTLDIALSGRQVKAEEALSWGLIDRIETGDVREVALAAARDVLAGRLATRRTGELEATRDEAALEAARAMVAKKMARIASAPLCIEAVARATGPLAEGMAFERQCFTEALKTPSGQGMIHAFFAERAVAKIPEAGATPRPVTKIGVIGGGTMGSGIATAALMGGLEVRLIEVADEALERGRATIAKNLDGAVKRGKMSAEKHDAALARLAPSTDMHTLADVDLVIEAVFENMEVKKEIFTKLDAICKPGAVLASNTSYLNIDEIARVTSRPQDVLGLHFFSPAHIMRLLEVVVAEKTAPEVVATGFALGKALRKVAVRAGVCDGFIGNRILAHYGKVIMYMLMDGADPAEIDAALEGFGLAMGPFKVGDLAGLDIGWAERKRRAPLRPAEERYIPIADRICEQGWFGRKTGRGWYLYDDAEIRPNPAAQAIIDAERARAGITPRKFTPEEIVDRFLTAMISESARVVADGIAQRPIDVDAVFLFGYGFPRFRGGPLHHADQIGVAELVARIEAYAKEDAQYWQVPPFLRKLAETGGSFAALNTGD